MFLFYLIARRRASKNPLHRKSPSISPGHTSRRNLHPVIIDAALQVVRSATG